MKIIVQKEWKKCGFNSQSDGDLCSGSNCKQVCSNCRRYIADIYSSLRKINDNHFETYIPYIARVSGSWFRDTYFLLPSNANGEMGIYNIVNESKGEMHELYPDSSKFELGSVNVINNDIEFLKGTGELWTRYFYDENGDYTLFLIDSKGEYFKNESDVQSWKNEFKNSTTYTNGDENEKSEMNECLNYIKNKYSIKEDGGKEHYGVFLVNDCASKSENRKKSKIIEENCKKYGISLVKKAQTSKKESNENISDFDGWSAYGWGRDDNPQKKPLSIDENSPKKIRRVYDAYNKANYGDSEGDYEPLFYYQLIADQTVSQKEDGQRGMTNPYIKYLFKNKKYYKYDESIDRAFAISNDWKEVKDLYKGSIGTLSKDHFEVWGRAAISSGLFGLGFWGKNNFTANKFDDAYETVLNGYIDKLYYDGESGISGNVFEFARDFDDDGIADIATPNFRGSSTAKGLKIDDEYTKFTYDPRNPNLISNIDINAEGLAAFSILENTHTADADYAYRDLKELIVELDYFDKEDLTEPPKEVLEWVLPESGSAGWPRKQFDKVNEYGTMIHSTSMYDTMNSVLSMADGAAPTSPSTPSNPQTAAVEKLYNEDEVLKLASANRVSSRSTQRDTNLPNQDYQKSTFLETAKACWECIIDKNPSYGAPGNTNWLATNQSVIDCTGYVAWVAYNYGYNDSTLLCTANYLNENYNAKHEFKEIELSGAISDISELQPGDILVRYQNGGTHHAQIICDIDTSSNTVKAYDCGSQTNWSSSNRDGMVTTFYQNTTPGKIIRVEGGAQKSSQAFNGFEKGQPIVSPATAKVLEMGTVEVTNEGASKIMERVYTSEEEENNMGDNDAEYKIVVKEDVKNLMQTNAEAYEADTTTSFGKTYTTGYIKLEIMGYETFVKFQETFKDDSYKYVRDGIDAYYRDYYNWMGKDADDIIADGKPTKEVANKYSICDSYTIYIEGVDLTGLMEDNNTTTLNIDETILGQLFKKNNDSGIELSSSSSQAVVTNDGNANAGQPQNGGNPTPTPTPTDPNNASFDINNYQLNYYTKKEIPTYYAPKAKEDLEKYETCKEALPSVMKLGTDIYVKAGTIIGVAGDANMNLIMKDKDEGIVENIEEYLEIDDFGNGNNIQKVDQEYEAQPNDEYRLAAMMHHEFCADSGFIANTKVRDESGNWVYARDRDAGGKNGGITDVSRTVAYVVINRALNEGKTIEQCITTQAYGSCAADYNGANANSGNWCATCLENAQWCLTYDCSSVVSSEGIPMTRNCTTQSSFDVNCSEVWNQPNDLERWWLVDANGDGTVTDHHHYKNNGAYDSFFLRDKTKNDEFNAGNVPAYCSEVIPH